MNVLNVLLLLLLMLPFAGNAVGEIDSPSAEKGSFGTLQQTDGSKLRAFIAGPENAKAAVLVVHDYLGISDATKQSVEHLGALP